MSRSRASRRLSTELGQAASAGDHRHAGGGAERGTGTAAMPQYSYTDLEEKLARAQRERDEALEREKATAEVLRVISSSPGDLAPVFEAILENATRMCGARIGTLFRYQNGAYTALAKIGVTREFAEYLERGPIFPAQTPGSAGSSKPNRRCTSSIPAPSRSTPRAMPGAAQRAISAASARCSTSPCSKMESWSVPSAFFAKKSGRSPTSRSSWSRTSRRRPSSP